jgi:flagellar biosynthesis protein FliR
MDLSLAQDHAVALLLHVVRAGAFFGVVPLFGRQLDTFALRLVLAVSLGGVFWWVGEQTVASPPGVVALGGMVVGEALVGVALGFALSTMTSLLVGAGEIVSSEMGFSLARTMNPESGIDATVVSQLLQVLGFLLILHFDVHHEALRVLETTYRNCPVGSGFDIGPVWAGLQTLVAGGLHLALHYAFPVLGIMLLLSAGLVLLGRAVPHINLMEFGFAARVLVALGVLTLFVGEGTPFLLQAFRGILDVAAAMFPG